MTPDNLALIHAQCFTTTPRPWGGPEIASLLDSARTFLLSRPQGFLIGRAVFDEAELLTLAVLPAARRQGIGRALLAEFEETALARGAAQVFLEVSADNPGALALYSGSGWKMTGRRRNYYAPGIDAVIMTKSFAPTDKFG